MSECSRARHMCRIDRQVPEIVLTMIDSRLCCAQVPRIEATVTATKQTQFGCDEFDDFSSDAIASNFARPRQSDKNGAQAVAPNHESGKRTPRA